MPVAPITKSPPETTGGSRSCPTVVRPKAKAARPTPESTKPLRSNSGTSRSRMFSMKRVARNTPRMPMGTLIQKIQRHEK